MRKHSTLITFFYICLGGIWLVLGSDLIEYLDRKTPDQDMRFLYDYKNIFFLVISGAILFLMIEWYRHTLSKVQEDYKQLFEGSPAAVYVFDKQNYKLLEVNEIMVEKYGYSKKELLNMTVFDIRPNTEQDRLKDYLDHDAEGGHETGIWAHKNKQGEIFHVLISYHSTIFKEKEAFIVIAVDVEKHRQAEQKIKELLKIYETVTQVTNDVIWEYHSKTDELYWMNGFEEIYGYTEAMRDNKRSWIVDKLHPEDRERVIASIDEAYLLRAHSWSCEYRFRCADGQYKYVFNQAFILLDENGEPEKLLGALRDITIRKNYEVSLLHKNEILKEIAWKNSHELRRPLSNMMGIMDLLKTDDTVPDHQATLLNMLEISAAELDELIMRISAAASDADLKS